MHVSSSKYIGNHHVKQKLSGFDAEPSTKGSIAMRGRGMRGFSDRMPNPSISNIEAVYAICTVSMFRSSSTCSIS